MTDEQTHRWEIAIEQIKAGGMVLAPHKFCSVVDAVVKYIQNGTIPPEPPKKEKEDTPRKGKKEE